MDYTIEVWSIQGNHFAQCTCGWTSKSLYQATLESYVNHHKKLHENHRDSVEVV